MNFGAIISPGEALQILQNDLRRAALEKHAAELKEAGPDKRQEILAQIDRDIERELRWHTTGLDHGTVLY
jgi:hypothetical protein